MLWQQGDLERQIEEQIQKGFKMSGHGFICVNRLETVGKITRKYR